MSYEVKLVTLQELYESGRTREPSLKALRARVDDQIPVFVEERSAHYFDEELSVIRLQAARKCKRPKVKWHDLQKAFEALDRDELNSSIIERLTGEASEREVVEWVVSLIQGKLRLTA